LVGLGLELGNLQNIVPSISTHHQYTSIHVVKLSQAVCNICFPRCLFDYIWSCCDLDLWPYELKI